MANSLNRRSAIKNLALGTTGLGLSLAAINSLTAMGDAGNLAFAKKNKIGAPLKGNINHSVCYWCYGDISLDSFAKSVAGLGIKGIDLLTPDQWDTVENHGLECAIATDSFASITNGFNDAANHTKLQEQYADLIKAASVKSIKQVIVFSGNKRNLTEAEGIATCAEGLAPLVKLAEEQNVTLIMELLNSKIDHPDYQCDTTPWGVKLCEQIGSANFKLLYDIYHMQIMEGDVIRTITEHHKYINHYHTGGVPGRNEINTSQELNYPAIMKAILATGYTGFVAQEFIPTYDDKIAALEEGVRICDV